MHLTTPKAVRTELSTPCIMSYGCSSATQMRTMRWPKQRTQPEFSKWPLPQLLFAWPFYTCLPTLHISPSCLERYSELRSNSSQFVFWHCFLVHNANKLFLCLLLCLLLEMFCLLFSRKEDSPKSWAYKGHFTFNCVLFLSSVYLAVAPLFPLRLLRRTITQNVPCYLPCVVGIGVFGFFRCGSGLLADMGCDYTQGQTEQNVDTDRTECRYRWMAQNPYLSWVRPQKSVHCHLL